MQDLPQDRPSHHALYSAEQMRDLDRCAIEELKIPGIQLMKRAGRSAFQLLLERWPQCAALEVFCGRGNNGGDGYILAGLAAARGIPALVWELKDAASGRGDAALARSFALGSGAELRPFTDYQPRPETEVIVDALLGTGVSGALKEPLRSAVSAINERNLPVLALDIPSGLDPDRGTVSDLAVFADITLSFIGLKAGLLTGQAADYCGEIEVDDLDLPAGLFAQVQPVAGLLNPAHFDACFGPRRATANKGEFGHLLILGGDLGYGGACLMAAEMALRSGAGRVSVITRPQHVPAILARCPEVMVHGIERPNQARVGELLAQADALVVGPGLGSSSWSLQLLYFALQQQLPTVLDADALNLLAVNPALKSELRGECILTPHPGEAARMLQTSAAEVQADRYLAAARLTADWPAVVVLKGSGSLVAAAGRQTLVCAEGNPGMATAGMGDILSGLLGGLLAQGLDSWQAAAAGVWLHARAADQAATDAGETGLLASDLVAPVRRLINELSGYD